MADSQFCNECGQRNIATAKFCSSCGAAMAATVEEESPTADLGGSTSMPPAGGADDLLGSTSMPGVAGPVDDLLGSTSMPGVAGPVDDLLGSTSMPGVSAPASPGAASLGPAAAVGGTTLGVGATLDERYLITKKLGEGGMGTVYLAMDTDTEQTVALKTISPHLAGNPAVLSSLKKEVGTARKLPAHPHLLRVLDIHLRSQPAFITLEAAMGGDLEEYWLAHSRKLDPADARRLILQILSGLQALHDARVVHQDIKPQNILLTLDGSVRITDYGISLSLREQLASGGHDGSGTVLYMSPEQCRGDVCDRRADLYSVGIMTYQLLTGGFPFKAKTQDEVKQWHLGGERVFGGLPPGFAEIVPRLLAIDPDDRPASAKAVIEALEVPADEPSPAGRPGPVGGGGLSPVPSGSSRATSPQGSMAAGSASSSGFVDVLARYWTPLAGFLALLMLCNPVFGMVGFGALWFCTNRFDVLSNRKGVTKILFGASCALGVMMFVAAFLVPLLLGAGGWLSSDMTTDSFDAVEDTMNAMVEQAALMNPEAATEEAATEDEEFPTTLQPNFLAREPMAHKPTSFVKKDIGPPRVLAQGGREFSSYLNPPEEGWKRLHMRDNGAIYLALVEGGVLGPIGVNEKFKSGPLKGKYKDPIKASQIKENLSQALSFANSNGMSDWTIVAGNPLLGNVSKAAIPIFVGSEDSRSYVGYYADLKTGEILETYRAHATTGIESLPTRLNDDYHGVAQWSLDGLEGKARSRMKDRLKAEGVSTKKGVLIAMETRLEDMGMPGFLDVESGIVGALPRLAAGCCPSGLLLWQSALGPIAMADYESGVQVVVNGQSSAANPVLAFSLLGPGEVGEQLPITWAYPRDAPEETYEHSIQHEGGLYALDTKTSPTTAYLLRMRAKQNGIVEEVLFTHEMGAGWNYIHDVRPTAQNGTEVNVVLVTEDKGFLVYSENGGGGTQYVDISCDGIVHVSLDLERNRMLKICADGKGGQVLQEHALDPPATE